ncbi:MAG: 2'-5' RNA ligase family protein [Candidatus Coatesbacteria bacterium]|nr:2'-5' RNA ligase family protein [Candidatus Coatesbacteria bacterium]
MNWRAILIFPRPGNLDEIEAIREKYDASYGKIAPHITLVFPFDSDIQSGELRTHVETVLGRCRPFPLRMQGITGQEGSCLFLNVVRGNDGVIALHRLLYSGMLARYRNLRYTFFPHLTVGRFSDEAAFEMALESLRACETTFETVVDEVSVTAIDARGCSVLQTVVPLRAS